MIGKGIIYTIFVLMNKGVLHCFCLFLRLSPLCAQLEEQPVPGQNLYVNQFYKAATQYPYLDGRDIRVSIKEFPFDSRKWIWCYFSYLLHELIIKTDE